MMNMNKQFGALMLGGLLLAGCAPYNVPPQQSMFNPNAQALAATQPNVVAPTQALQQSQSALDKVSEVDERVRRVERAMIRLDRRMQIIERNELARLSGGMSVDQNQQQANLQPTSYALVGGDEAIPESTISPQFAPNANSVRGLINNGGASLGTPSVTGSYMASDVQPVSYSGGVVGVGAATGLPSLADNKAESTAPSNLAVWTVTYDENKIWPTRDQLAASRDVVDSLRGGGQVTVFARGARPSSKVFRERVRAISRYLGRVAGSDSIPIASMPSENLSEETIEVMVTR
jgi:hypothetical protein